jgi:PKD repeat protein
MKTKQKLILLSAAFGLALTCSTAMAAITIQTTSWTNTFPSGTNTSDFKTPYMQWWWGSWTQCSGDMTNDPTMNPNDGDGSGYGSLYAAIPFSASGQQGWFYTTFDKGGGWGDGSVQIPLKDISRLSFDIYIKSGTPLDANGNLGWIGYNLIMGSNNGAFTPTPVPNHYTMLAIPAAADGAWVHLYDTNTISDVALDINAGYTNAAAAAFYINNDDADGYPPAGETYTFWIDNVAVTTAANTNPPVAQFNMSQSIGVAPFTVNFTDTSLNSPTSWKWTFGDGGTSTAENPSHTFTNMWRQTVTLVASNAYGLSTNSKTVYQCFRCDALYEWTGGSSGQVAAVASMSNSLVAGGNTLGYFYTTNRDVPQSNLRGIIFTNISGMTNGCPVVFSNGTIYSNFTANNALAYSWTNDFEQYDFKFNSGYTITNLVLVFYDSMPLSTNTWSSCVDELNIATMKDGADLGSVCLNRNLGLNGPLLPGYQNDTHTSETCNPTYYGNAPFSWLTNAQFPGSAMYLYPNKVYRIIMQYNTNTEFDCAIADPVTSQLVGFVTNYDTSYTNSLIQAYANGHTSWEVYTNNGFSTMVGDTSILAYHSIISVNRPLTWAQITNVVMFGP